MASTYSTLKVELIGTGDQTGTWGTTTNDNFSVALGEAITGSADVAFSSANVTVTLTDTNAAQTARNLRLNLTGTSGGARNLILGSGCQIEKLYLINNGLADAVTVKNTSGTGIAVPAGKSMFVFNNGTNVVDAVTHLSSLTLATALPVASGGTGTATPSLVAGTNVTVSGSFPNQTITATSSGTVSSVNLTAGTAISVSGGPITTSGSITVNNTGVTSLVAGTGISVSAATGAVTVASTVTGGIGVRGQVFTSSGTFTIPSGITAIKVTMVGAGGGGGGASGNGGDFGSGGGGAGGGVATKYFTGLTSGNTLTVSVGAAGTAGSAAPGAGGTGGTSSVASGTQSITTTSAAGGGGGSGGNQVAAAGGTGATTFANADISIPGGAGAGNTTSGGAGGASGGGDGGAVPGSGAYGRGGRSQPSEAAGNAGVGFGNGGGGAREVIFAKAGSVGRAGLIVIEF